MHATDTKRLVLVGSATMLAVALLLASQVRPTAAAACDAPTKTFDNGAGDGEWTTATNWSPDGVPGSLDDVCVGAPVIIGTSNTGFARTFQVSPGGHLIVEGGATFAVSGASGSTVDDGATLTIDGNASGPGLVTIAGDVVLVGAGAVSLPLTTTAGGLINKVAAGTKILSNVLTNAGLVDVDGGTLQLSGASGSSAGITAIAAGAVVNHTSGAYTYGATATLEGAGELRVSGASVSLAAGASYDVATLTVTAGTLTVNAATTMDTVTQTGGTITGPGDLTITTLTMSGTGLVMSGGNAATTRATGSAFLSVPSGTMVLGRTLTFDVDASLTGSGALASAGSGQGLLHLDTELTLGGLSQISVPVTITPDGILAKTVAGTTIMAGTLTNDGLLDVQTGTISISATTAGGGGITAIAAGAVVNHTSGAYTYGATATLEGAGELRVSGASVSLAAGASYDVATLTVTAGTLTVNAATTMDTVTQTGGTITGPGDLTITTLTMSGTGLVMSGGNAATTRATGSAFLSVPSGTMVLGRTLTFDVDASLTGSGALASAGSGQGLLHLDTELTLGGLSQISVPVTITPDGILAKTVAGTTIMAGTLTNDGLLDVQTGTISISATTAGGGGITAIAAGAVVNHTSGAYTYGATATLEGAGELRVSGASVSLAAGASYDVATLTVTAGTLTVNAATTMDTVTQTGGTITGPGDLTITTLTMSGTGLVMSGGNAATTRATGSAFLSVPSGTMVLGRTLTFDVDASLTGSGALASAGSGQGLLHLDTELTLGGLSQISVPVTITPDGILAKTVAGTTIMAGTLTNDGLLDVQTGTISISATTAGGGGITAIAAGAVVNHTSGAYTYGATATLEGAGELRVSGASVSLAAGASYELPAIQVSGGSLTVNQPYTVEAILQTGGTITGPGDLTATDELSISGAATMSGGSLSTTLVAPSATATIAAPSGTIALGRTLSIAAGASATFSGNGAIASAGGGTGRILNTGDFVITGNSQLTITITNLADGAITKSSTGTTSFTGEFSNAGDLTVGAGTLSLTGAFTNYDQPTDVLTGGAFHVAGTLRFIGADIATNQATIHLTGTPSAIVDTVGNDGFRDLTRNEGTLSIDGGRTLTLPTALTNTGSIVVGSGSTLVTPGLINDGGTVSGSGTIIGPVTTTGTVQPGSSPGILTIDGSLSQSAAGTLAIEIGGTDAGSGHDRLDVSGAATLAGTLTLAPTGGFVPAAGSTFTILQYASHSGCFDHVLGRDLGALAQGLFFDVTCLPTSAVVMAERVEFSIDDVSLTEGDEGTLATFTISRNVSRPDLTTSVDWTTSDGTAGSPQDFVPRSGTVTFPAGDPSLTASVVIDVSGDLLDEFDETFTIELSNTTNAVVVDASGTATIVDDDPPPTISITGTTVTELDASTVDAVFQIELSGPSGKPISIDYATTGGTATPGVDYPAFSGSFTLQPGDTSAGVVLGVIGDLLDEFDETFDIELSNPVNVVIDDGSATATILDDDPPPTISVTGTTVTEGDAGTTANATFTVSLSAASGKAISVDYATGNGVAEAGSDYTATTGTLAFAPGETTHDVDVPITGDALDETDEAFSLALDGEVNATLATASATGVIVDDDPLPSVSIAGTTVTEGDSGTVDATFAVTLSAPSGRTVTVAFRTEDGTAFADEDYTAAIGSVSIKPGDTSAAITVKVTGDLLDETDEQFTVRLVDPGAAVLGEAVATGTIVDDDGAPELSIGDLTVVEGDGDVTQASFTVSLSAPSANEVTVVASTGDGSATAGEDFGFATGTLTFAPGATTQAFAVGIIGDLIDEVDETFTVELTVPTSATIDDGIATATITDDDPAPSISIDDPTLTEGDSGTTPATFTVTLSAPSGRTITVSYATTPGSALAGEDYLHATGSVSFAPGETSRPVDVDILGDTAFEADETFRVDLSSAVHATIADPSGTATITNDDAASLLAIDDASANEGDSGTTPMTFSVSLSAPSSAAVTVAWSTVDDDATAGEDYAGDEGIVTFLPGDVAEPIVIDLIGDTIDENDETFRVLLAGPTGALVGDGSGTATIVDDDGAATVDVSITKSASAAGIVVAGDRLTYTLAVGNLGSAAAETVQVSDELPYPSTPDDARWCEVIAPATTCDPATGEPYDSPTAIPAIDKLMPGTIRTFRIGYTLAATAPSGPMSNTASVTTPSVDTDPTNDASTVELVVNRPPEASFVVTPATPVVGTVVSFDASTSTDDNGIADYAWTFDDGQVANGQIVTHTFPFAATFHVQLTVTDETGADDQVTISVNVAPNNAPPAGRVLRGTITKLLTYGPGSAPTPTSVPLAGALVTVGQSRSAATTTADAQGRYALTQLSCANPCPVIVTAPDGTQVASTSVAFASSQSTITLDLSTAGAPNLLLVSGQVVAPEGGSDPATIAIRVFQGGTLLADSAVVSIGPGGFGTYRIPVAGTRGLQVAPNSLLRVALVENGVEVASTTVLAPPATGSARTVTAADLTAPNNAPPAGRVLRGTITKLLTYGPGSAPTPTSVPLAGALVTVGQSRSAATTRTDAQGRYALTQLSCANPCPVIVTAPDGTQVASTSVAFASSQSTITLDLSTAGAPNLLLVSGQVVAPEGGSDPATIAIRVFQGGTLLADSAVVSIGPGGFGTYRIPVAGTRGLQVAPNSLLRVALVENGVEVASTTVLAPPATGSARTVTAADLTAPNNAPPAGRVLRGTITKLLTYGPGSAPTPTSVPLAGAEVTVGQSRSAVMTRTDAQGRYALTQLSCANPCPVIVTAPDGTQVASTSVAFATSQSMVTLDLSTATAPNLLLVGGQVVAPEGGSDPATIAIRVFQGGTLLADSAVVSIGPGGFGTYRIPVAGTRGLQVAPNSLLRVALVENGVEVASTTVLAPPATGSARTVTAADLVGQ